MNKIIKTKYCKKSHSMNIIKKSCSELVEDRDIEIPAVQRGLVWSAQQVGTLWDSIINNMPIGSFMAYREQDNGNNRLQLIDGQQRFNAIQCGIIANAKEAEKCGADISDNSGFRVWVGILSDKPNKLFFMACSESQPWGYDENYGPYKSEDKAKFNSWLKKESYEEDSPDDDFFKTAKLSSSYPALAKEKKVIFIPLPYAIKAANCENEEERKNVYKQWQDCDEKLKLYIKPSEVIELLNADYAESDEKADGGWGQDKIEEAFVSICNILHACSVLKYKIIIHEIEHKQKLDNEYISTLFSRINTQGTQLASDDERYCALCVMLGKVIKENIGKLSTGFMPPARLANWAVRLYMIKYANKEITTSATDGEFREVAHESSPTCENCNVNDNFTNFCKVGDKEDDYGELQRIIATIKQIYSQENSEAVPPLVYLENKDDNWLTVIARMIQLFPRLFENDSENKKWYPLLGMLPYVVCSRYDCAHHFMKRFLESLDPLQNDSGLSLLKVISYGCANAALYENTFVQFLPSELSGLKLIAKRNVLDHWWNWTSVDSYESRSVIQYTYSRYILYYAQRKYLRRILKDMKPHKKELWSVDANKPFDIDHIIPRSYWPNEWMMDRIPNKQVLFYRHNRRKNNNYCGVFSKLAKTRAEYSDWFLYETENQYDECVKRDDNDFESYKQVTEQRWRFIIEKVYAALGLDELVNTINGFYASYAESKPDFEQLFSRADSRLKNAILRYHLFCSFEHIDLSWGCIVYRGLSRNNVIGLAKINIPNTFHLSLAPSLTIGVEGKINHDLPILYGLTVHADGTVKVGIRSGFGVSPYIDATIYEKWNKITKIDDAWLEVSSSFTLDDKQWSSLKANVMSTLRKAANRSTK